MKHRCTDSLRAAGTCRMMETSWRVGCAIDCTEEMYNLDYAKISTADLNCRVALSDKLFDKFFDECDCYLRPSWCEATDSDGLHKIWAEWHSVILLPRRRIPLQGESALFSKEKLCQSAQLPPPLGCMAAFGRLSKRKVTKYKFTFFKV